ncbi:DUF5753 domain-containing protein [Actinomadura gamaensis]|uniref:DUF5753 domain-containing protein n=1 Tax=Actinomadura gamaensis TaxID=1763541 RepID=A0ABV9U1H9_9ACTN
MSAPERQCHPCGGAVEALRRNLRLAGRPTLNTLDRLSRRLEGREVHGVAVVGVPRSTLSDLFNLVPARRPRREKVESVWAVIYAYALDKGLDVSAMVSLEELRDLYDRRVPAEGGAEDASPAHDASGFGVPAPSRDVDRSPPLRAAHAPPVHRTPGRLSSAASRTAAGALIEAPERPVPGRRRTPGQVLADAGLRGRRAWWRPYDDVVPPDAERYLTLEPDLADIRVFAPARVPDLLLSADYARHLFVLDTPDTDPDRLRRRVELLEFRQDVLFGPRPPRLWAIITRRALALDVGDDAVRRAQLRHLIGMAGRPGVTVQILADEDAGFAVADGAVTVMRFPDRDRPDLVRVEQSGTSIYPDEPDVISHFVAQHGRLLIKAEPPERTLPLLRSLLAEG